MTTSNTAPDYETRRKVDGAAAELREAFRDDDSVSIHADYGGKHSEPWIEVAFQDTGKFAGEDVLPDGFEISAVEIGSAMSIVILGLDCETD